MTHFAALIGLGTLAGMTSGLIGIGGGIIIVPVRVLFFRFPSNWPKGPPLR